MQHWSVRRVGILLLVLVALIPAVPMAWAFARSSANPGGAALVTGANGACTQVEALWLQAQAVPSASLVPCIDRRALPVGVVASLHVRDGESLLELSRASVEFNIGSGGQPGVAGEAGTLTIRLAAACDVPTTGQGRAVAPGVQRFQPQGATAVADVFAGGCVTYRPGPSGSATPALLDQAQRATTYRTRDDLRGLLLRRSKGLLDLDPA